MPLVRFPRRLFAVALASMLVAAAVGSAPPAIAQRQGGLGPQSVAPTAKRLIPAVVNISTSQLARGPKGVPLPEVPEGAPFEKFFDDFFSDEGNGGMGKKVSSLGSGFVIDGKEGLIVTNNHVITDADEIYANFSDGSKLKVVKVLGRDAKTDLALLKVEPKKPLAEVKFGSSETIEVGDWVMAIGNPFGLGGTVTVGIISAKQRDINSGPYDDYLQTDAAINKGNSGGPLFNMEGDVIGVNTAIISPTGGSIGIGFAVPSDTVVNVVAQLREFGEMRRGWLGVRIQSITEDMASTLGVEENKGALVAAVEDDSPAAKAGIKDGDVVLTFDGKQVATMRGLPKIVAETPIGTSVPVEVLRDGKKLTLQVTVGQLAEAETAEADSSTGETPSDEQTDGSLPGLTLANLDDTLIEKYKLEKDIEGVVITGVEAESVAAKRLVKEGDVIVMVSQQPVTSVAEVEDLVKAARAARSGPKSILIGLKSDRPDLRLVSIPLQ